MGVTTVIADRQRLAAVRAVVLDHAATYFRDVFGLRLDIRCSSRFAARTLDLRELTAVIALGGLIKVAVALSFDGGMVRSLSQVASEGIGLDERDRDRMMEETAADAINAVVGLSTGDLCGLGERISMSLPAVIGGPRQVDWSEEVAFAKAVLSSELGQMDLWCVAPHGMFSGRVRFS